MLAEFGASAFKDEYELALSTLVKRKAAGHTIERKAPAADRSNVIDLMEALRQSVSGKQASKQPARKSAKRTPPRKRGTS